LSTVGQVTAYARFAVGLRSFLRDKATAELGRETIRQRLRDRDSRFLTLMKRAVCDNLNSPYRALLHMAGCEYGDLERMVRQEGIEHSLQSLRDSGVYLTSDEFRCTRDVVRGNTVLHCLPDDFENPFLIRGITTGSSGSRGPRTRTTANLERSRYNALYYSVMLSAHGLFGRPTVLWRPTLPSSVGLGNLLSSSKMGVPPERWFSPVSTRAFKPSLRTRMATLYVVYVGRMLGTRMPAPEYVSGEQTGVILDYLRDFVRGGRSPVVFASVSSAVRACHLAKVVGYDFSQVTFFVGGEPLTPAKLAEIHSSGASAVSQYACAECGIVGLSCAGDTPACDDVHLLTTSVACIQRKRHLPFGDGTVDALLFSSLAEKAPKVLLNVEVGDYGVLETRDCGCELGALGLTQHLHTIRSYDKLTGEGMTFVGTDMVRVIEELLPARFGGASTDYQMVEREGAAGRTRLDIIVSPRVGDVDDMEVVEVVLSELQRGGDTNRMMSEMWRQRGALAVIREEPATTAGGKLLPLRMLSGRRDESGPVPCED